MKVLILDNYDSFTYNLYQYVGTILMRRFGSVFSLDVKRNNAITFDEILDNKYDRIIISPGPGRPDDPDYFGVCHQVISELYQTIPILGVCLGLQGIACIFGGKLLTLDEPMHGKTSSIIHDGLGVFKSLPQKIEVMRYHSLVVDPLHFPDELILTSVIDGSGSPSLENISADTQIMGLRHKDYPLEGIQFHPESFATEGGLEMIENFLAAENK